MESQIGQLVGDLERLEIEKERDRLVADLDATAQAERIALLVLEKENVETALEGDVDSQQLDLRGSVPKFAAALLEEGEKRLGRSTSRTLRR